MLGGLVARAGGLTEPFYRFSHILGNTAAGLIAEAEVALGRGTFLIGGAAIPLDRFLMVLRDDRAALIIDAEVELSLGFSLVGGGVVH